MNKSYMTSFALANCVSLVNSDASKLMVEVLRIFVSGKCARVNFMSLRTFAVLNRIKNTIRVQSCTCM